MFWKSKTKALKVKAKIYLKSGSVLEITVPNNGLKTTSNTANELIKLAWEDIQPHILYINLSQIEAIVWE